MAVNIESAASIDVQGNKERLLENGARVLQEYKQLTEEAHLPKDSPKVKELGADFDKLAEEWAAISAPEKRDREEQAHYDARLAAAKEKAKVKFADKVENSRYWTYDKAPDNEESDGAKAAKKGNGTEAGGESAEGEEGTVETKVAIQDLRKEVTEYMKSKASPALVVERLLQTTPSSLAPSDLVGGDRQLEAVAVAFSLQPDLATYFRERLAMDPKSKEYKEAQTALKDLSAQLQKAYDALSDARRAREEVETDTLTQGIGNRLQDAVKTMTKNPVESAVLVSALLGGLYLLYSKGGSLFGEKFKNVAMWGTGIGLTVIGGDFLWSKVNPEHQSLLDRFELNPDSLTDSVISQRFQVLLADMPEKSRQAMKDIVRLGNTRCSGIAAAYEEALRAGTDSISGRSFFAEGSIGKTSFDHMDEKQTYKGIDYAIGLCTAAAGASGLPERDRKLKCLEYFKKKYGEPGREYTLFTAIYDIKNPGTKVELKPGADGLMRPVDARAGILLGRAAPTEEAKAQALGVQELFNDFADLEATVEARKEGFIAIQGYLWGYEFHENPDGTKVHIFRDPIAGGTNVEVPVGKSGDDGTLVKLTALKEHSEARFKTRFDAKYGANPAYVKFKDSVEWVDPADHTKGATGVKLELVFNKEGGYYELKPPFRTTDHAGLGSRKHDSVALQVYHDEEYKDDLALYIQGEDTSKGAKRYEDFDKVVDAFDKEVTVHQRVRDDLAGLVGANLAFNVKSIADTTTDTTVTINYGVSNLKIGTIVYKSGVVDSITLEDDPALKAAQEEVARAEASSYIDALSGSPEVKNLKAVFEGHWHPDAWSELTQAWGQMWEAGDRAMGKEAPFASGREGKWNDVIQAKLDEAKYLLSIQMTAELTKDPAAVAGGAPATTHKYNPTPDLRSFGETAANGLKIDFRTFYSEIDHKLGVDPGDGHTLESTLIDYAKKVEEVGYGDRYIEFTDDLEEVMQHYDFKGADNMVLDSATARAIRDTIRRACLKLSYPIPAQASVTPGSPEDKYLEYLLGEVESALKRNQLDDSGNVILLGITIDRRVDSAGFEATLRKQGTADFQEKFKAAPGTFYAGVGSGLSVGPTGAPRVGGLEAGELTKMVEKGRDRIYKAFDLAEGVSWNPVSQQDYILEMRINRLLDQMIPLIRAEASKPNADDEIEKIIAKFETEAESEGIEHINKDALASERLLVKATLDKRAATSSAETPKDNEWAPSADIAFLFLRGNYKHEKYAFEPAPESLVYLMDLYYRKIGHGAAPDPATVDPKNPKPPEEYTNYFLTQIENALSGQSDMALDGLYAKSDADWKIANNPETQMDQVRAMLERITPYSSWDAKTQKLPTLPELSLDLSTAKAAREKQARFEAYKKEKAETFMDDFDSTNDLSTVFGIEGGWPEAFRTHVETRLPVVLAGAATEADVDAALVRFGEYVKVEKGIYALLIQGNVDENDVTVIRDSIGTIGPIFETCWKTTATAANYSTVLLPKFITNIQSMPKDDLKSKGKALKEFWDELPEVSDELADLLGTDYIDWFPL